MTMEELQGLFDAVESAHSEFEGLSCASTLSDQATAFNRMMNAMSDLASWHPKYNSDTGQIDTEEDNTV